jgi:hypothetical protein
LYLLPGILRVFVQDTAYFHSFSPVFQTPHNRAKGYRFNPLRGKPATEGGCRYAAQSLARQARQASVTFNFSLDIPQNPRYYRHSTFLRLLGGKMKKEET